MWYYYRARMFIANGYEAINFSNVNIISERDTSHTNLKGLLTRIRNYAATNARRRWVFCNAFTRGIAVSGQLLFDFHEMPMRPTEVIGSPHQAILQLGYADSIYGNSLGGTSPSGWSCAALPYTVELDNYGGSNGDSTHAATTNNWTWGWDEISWFANLPEQSRNDWLWYASGWIAVNDPNGHLMMPGARVVASNDAVVGEGYVSNWMYNANTFSGNCLNGFNQEETIKKIWYSGCKAYSKADFNGDCNVDFEDFAAFAAIWMNDAGRIFN